MYTITTGENIEFFFKDDNILLLAERESAFQARSLGLIDSLNFTKDEYELGYDYLRDVLVDIFIDLEKQMVDGMYLHEAGGSHGADHYSGFFIFDNEQYSNSLLLALDSMINKAAKYGVLSEWYRVSPMPDLFQFFTAKFRAALIDLHNFAFILRKPEGRNVINITNDVMSDRVEFNIVADTPLQVDHAINTSNYVIEIYDATTGEEVELYKQERHPGYVILYSSRSINGLVMYVVGDRE